MRPSAGTAGGIGGPTPPLRALHPAEVPRDEATQQLLRAAVEAPPPFLRGVRPWRLRAGAGQQVTELWASPSRDLRALDPTGRVVQIACGAALLRLRLAAAVAGREPVDRLLPRPGEPQLLATIRLAGPRQPSQAERVLHAVIGRPVANGVPTAAPVPASLLGDLAQAAAIEGAVLDIVDSPVVPSRRPGPGPARPAAQRRHAGPGKAPGLIAVIYARPGTRAGWLRTGQALQRVLLLATAHGISARPFPPVPEAPDARLADVLVAFGIGQPQLILQLSRAAC
jgi:hypothetical protein